MKKSEKILLAFFCFIALLLDSITLSEEFTKIGDEDKPVNVYSVIPLYQQELDYTIAHGIGKLMERFEAFGIDEVVDVGRQNTCQQ